MLDKKNALENRIVFIEFIHNGLNGAMTVNTVQDVLDLISDSNIRIIPNTPLARKLFKVKLDKIVYKPDKIIEYKPTFKDKVKQSINGLNKIMFARVF